MAGIFDFVAAGALQGAGAGLVEDGKAKRQAARDKLLMDSRERIATDAITAREAGADKQRAFLADQQNERIIARSDIADQTAATAAQTAQTARQDRSQRAVDLRSSNTTKAEAKVTAAKLLADQRKEAANLEEINASARTSKLTPKQQVDQAEKMATYTDENGEKKINLGQHARFLDAYGRTDEARAVREKIRITGSKEDSENALAAAEADANEKGGFSGLLDDKDFPEDGNRKAFTTRRHAFHYKRLQGERAAGTDDPTAVVRPKPTPKKAATAPKKPTHTTTPAAQKKLLAQGRAAIKAGKKRSAVIKVLRDAGVTIPNDL